MVRSCHLHIGVGSALLVLDCRAMREPRDVERVTGTIPRFFIFSSNHFAWESARTKNKRSMKRILSTVVMAMMLLMSFAQIPLTFSYQAVVRDAENNLVVSKPIVLELSILQGSDVGEVVYSEKHIVSTNSNGLISLEMGAGVSKDDFSAIDWSNAPYFVKTVAEFDGKTITGITPLLAVPYALYAEKAGNAEVDLSGYYSKEEVDALLAALESIIENGGGGNDGGSSPQGNVAVENGAIMAAFSISDSKQIYFSQGNLQYQASTGTWRFAEHQYDMIGSDNSNISSS